MGKITHTRPRTPEELEAHLLSEIPIESVMVFENGAVRAFNDQEMDALQIQMIDSSSPGIVSKSTIPGYGPNGSDIEIVSL